MLGLLEDDSAICDTTKYVTRRKAFALSLSLTSHLTTVSETSPQIEEPGGQATPSFPTEISVRMFFLLPV